MIGWKNHDCEKIIIQFRIEKMKKYLDSDEEPYFRTYIKQKLMDHCVDEVSFHEASVIQAIVILQRKAEKIIESVEAKKLRIIETAAQLIGDEIKSVREVYVGGKYPLVNFNDPFKIKTSDPIKSGTVYILFNYYRKLYHAGHFSQGL